IGDTPTIIENGELPSVDYISGPTKGEISKNNICSETKEEIPSTNDGSPTKGEAPSTNDIGPTKGEIPSTNDRSPTKGETPSTNAISPTKGETPLMMNSIGSPVEPLVPPYVDAKVIVYAALSGMVSFLPNGTIHGCNHHFSLMLTGYSQDELLRRDITFLMPEFYSHVGYVDDQGMPLPPLDEGSDDISFQSVAERSLSPDSAFDYLSSRAHVPPSPVRRKNHEVQRSPVRNLNHHGQSPAHSHHHQPLTSGGPSTSPHATANVSPRHQIMRGADKNIPGGFSGGHGTMPTLLEEEEEREGGGEKRSNEVKSGRGSERKEVGGGFEGRAVGLDEEEEEERKREGEEEEREGEESEEEEREEGEERNYEEEQKADEEETESQYPISSTPASKTPDSLLVKTDSFSEYLRAAAVPGGAAGESDGISVSSIVSLPEGLFQGFIRHKDGSSIAVVFQLKCIPLAGDQSLFCVWLCRDMNRDWTINREDPYWTDQVGISPDVIEDVDTVQDPHQHSTGSEESLAVAGVYRSCYDTLRPVGKGAFGFVRLAQRKSDKQLVVVKFLRKSGVLKDCWVHDRDMGLVAQEISLLARLNHPNIVMLLEAYENECYFQLVMEKHGDGLDLFEFIERCPKITEPLVSYMFRQVVAGLSYLHGKNILHRDVKDENIIMNEHFHMKLIDFGSAAYMEPGKLFHTFCGTLEYCSPEVLLGNRYDMERRRC
ncbi:PAS domain-containing serine/threonine-protein kinase, partial [Geodia barretti]